MRHARNHRVISNWRASLSRRKKVPRHSPVESSSASSEPRAPRQCCFTPSEHSFTPPSSWNLRCVYDHVDRRRIFLARTQKCGDGNVFFSGAYFVEHFWRVTGVFGKGTFFKMWVTSHLCGRFGRLMGTWACLDGFNIGHEDTVSRTGTGELVIDSGDPVRAVKT